CLDFTNTVRARPLSDRIEYIKQYSDLVSWARQATIITPGEAALLDEDVARGQARPGSGHVVGVPLGRRAAHLGRSATRPRVCRLRLRLALHGYDQESQPPLVRHDHMREPGEGPAPL